MTDFRDVPVLDIAALHSENDDAKRLLQQQIYRIYSEVGFAYITNHGVDQGLIDAVFEQNRRFCEMPFADKMQVELNRIHRGYIPINTSTDRHSKLADVTRPNQSESFMMMREAGLDDADRKAGKYLAGPNRWPGNLPGFKEVVTAYNDVMAVLAEKLLQAIASAIGVTTNELMRKFTAPTTWLRLLHYPPRPLDAPRDLYGSAPHCDFGCITLLAQDQVGGLQVQNPTGQWVDAPFIAGTFVMNVGDMLHRLSNGQLRSTPHRVINRSGVERYSVVFFYDPDVSASIEPLADCVSVDSPARFTSEVFGDYLRTELSGAYDRHRTTIKKSKRLDIQPNFRN
jgi:isopenicillin N synthase-like dioxygenase